MQEVAWGLAGLPLRGSSRSFVKVGVGYPENRVGILVTGAMRAAGGGGGGEAVEEEGDGDGEGGVGEGGGGESALALGLLSYYAARPLSLEHLSLFNFASNQEVTSRSKTGSINFTIGRATKYVTPRSKPAVVRVYPRMSPEAHGGEYFYGMLLLHVPWRDEQQSFPRTSDDDLERQFLLHQPHMQLQHATFADDMAAAVERLQALGSQEHGYGGMAPGAQEQEGDAADEMEREGGGGGDAGEWGALHPGEDMYGWEGGEDDEGELQAQGVVGGGGEDAALAQQGSVSSAARGRMTDAQWQQVQSQLQGTQRTVFDVLRRHIRDTQRAAAQQDG